jgi:hypothetical protein
LPFLLPVISLLSLRKIEKQFNEDFQRLKSSFKESSLSSPLAVTPPQYCSYDDFQEFYCKKSASTFRELFGFQLRQIHGCSGSTVNTLMKKFGTTASFMKYLRSNDRTAVEVNSYFFFLAFFLAWLLACFLSLTSLLCVQKTLEGMMKEGESGRRIGPKLAKKIVAVYYDDY